MKKLYKATIVKMVAFPPKKKVDYLILADDMFKAEKLIKEKIKNMPYKFLSIMPSNKNILIQGE